MTLPTFRRKTAATAAALALLVFPLAACGEDDGDGDGGSGGGVDALAEIEQLQGETTAVKLDSGFTGAAEQLGLTLGVAGSAKLQNGSLVFPITGGNVSLFEPGSVPNYVTGQIQHEGSGFTISAGGTTVTIGNLNVDPGISKVYGDVAANGDRVVDNAIIFDLDGSTLMPVQMQGQNAILEGTQVKISKTAAALLNETYSTDAVKPGLLVGIAKITANTKSSNKG